MARSGTKRRLPGQGAIRQLRSGRWQARFTGPDGVMRPAPQTFDTKLDAQAWLDGQADDVARGRWTAPEATGSRRQTFRDYATLWLAHRDLKPRTRAQYRATLDSDIIPVFGDVILERITPTSVRNWYASMDQNKATKRAHAYGILRAILGTAFSEDLIPSNPCRVPSGSTVKRRHEVRPASLAELEVIREAMPVRYQPMVDLAAWCALRFGELTELRRSDVDLEEGVIRVRRAVTRAGKNFVVDTPKTTAGIRTVHIPSNVLPALTKHMQQRVKRSPDALVFPARSGGHMAPSALYTVFYPARAKAGRPDLRWHDLRHTGAVLAATAGATTADLMQRLGHSSAQAAMLYQHAAEDRDRVIAEALAEIAAGDTAQPIPLRRRA